MRAGIVVGVLLGRGGGCGGLLVGRSGRRLSGQGALAVRPPRRAGCHAGFISAGPKADSDASLRGKSKGRKRTRVAAGQSRARESEQGRRPDKRNGPNSYSVE